MPALVDSNVILDLVTQDPVWEPWSRRALESPDRLVANSMIYAELCCNANSPEEVDKLFASLNISLEEIPRRALYLASKAHLAYRKQGGGRTTGLPDFFIGAHAQVLGIPIVTRDSGRYKTYFPMVPLITP